MHLHEGHVCGTRAGGACGYPGVANLPVGSVGVVVVVWGIQASTARDWEGACGIVPIFVPCGALFLAPEVDPLKRTKLPHT